MKLVGVYIIMIAKVAVKNEQRSINYNHIEAYRSRYSKVVRCTYVAPLLLRLRILLIVTLCRRNLKTELSLWKRFKCFPYTLRRKNFKTHQSAINFNCVCEKLGHAMIKVTPSFPKNSVFKMFSRKRKVWVFKLMSAFARLRTGDGLVWTVG